MKSAISGLETLEGQAQGLETDVSDAQGARDGFFGAGGAGYADAAAITSEIGTLETLEAQALTTDVSDAHSQLTASSAPVVRQAMPIA